MSKSASRRSIERRQKLVVSPFGRTDHVRFRCLEGDRPLAKPIRLMQRHLSRFCYERGDLQLSLSKISKIFWFQLPQRRRNFEKKQLVARFVTVGTPATGRRTFNLGRILEAPAKWNPPPRVIDIPVHLTPFTSAANSALTPIPASPSFKGSSNENGVAPRGASCRWRPAPICADTWGVVITPPVRPVPSPSILPLKEAPAVPTIISPLASTVRRMRSKTGPNAFLNEPNPVKHFGIGSHFSLNHRSPAFPSASCTFEPRVTCDVSAVMRTRATACRWCNRLS
jgi:hypothetical protein